MPPSNHRKNKTQRMPPVHESLHARKTRGRLHGQQRRNLPRLGKKRSRPNLADPSHQATHTPSLSPAPLPPPPPRPTHTTLASVLSFPLFHLTILGTGSPTGFAIILLPPTCVCIATPLNSVVVSPII